jgi:hypothetical protein
LSGEVIGPNPDDRKVTIAGQAVDAGRGGQRTFVRYGTGLFWLGSVTFLGVGTAFVLSSFAWLGAFFLAFGGGAVAALIRPKRIGDFALVIDDEGIAHTGLWGTRYRVPWTEVTGARAGEYGVFVELRAPRIQFRLPPRITRRKRDHGSLLLRSLAISAETLVELIQAHLPGASETGER